MKKTYYKWKEDRTNTPKFSMNTTKKTIKGCKSRINN